MNNFFMNNPLFLQWLQRRQMQQPQGGLFASFQQPQPMLGFANKQQFQQPLPQITNPIRQPLPVFAQQGIAPIGSPARNVLPVPNNTMANPMGGNNWLNYYKKA